MLAAPPWEAFTAAHGSVFHTGRFLLPWWRDRSAKQPTSRLITTAASDAAGTVGVCAFELHGDALSFAGGDDVVDYMGAAALPGREKEVAGALARCILDKLPWKRARLAGLAGDDATAQAFIEEITRRAPSAVIEPYDRAPRIEQAPQGYLQLLNSKRRADVLRKRNRLAEAAGELELVTSTPSTVRDALERLLAWKAEASPATREFVDEYGEFVRTMVVELACADACDVVELHVGGRPVASAITLRHRDTVYIYNMAYDLTLAAEGQAGLAPGVVLVSLLVERSLSHGMRFDFLKGAQEYKLRLGGSPVDLIAITIER